MLLLFVDAVDGSGNHVYIPRGEISILSIERIVVHHFNSIIFGSTVCDDETKMLQHCTRASNFINYCIYLIISIIIISVL